MRAVTIERAVGNETVIASGLETGEIVVTDGQLLLSNDSRVVVREQKGRRLRCKYPKPASGGR